MAQDTLVKNFDSNVVEAPASPATLEVDLYDLRANGGLLVEPDDGPPVVHRGRGNRTQVGTFAFVNLGSVTVWVAINYTDSLDGTPLVASVNGPHTIMIRPSERVAYLSAHMRRFSCTADGGTADLYYEVGGYTE
jgi:hypothetical protein